MTSLTSLLCHFLEVVWRLLETNRLIDSLFILTSRASYLFNILPLLWIFMQDESSLFCVLRDWGRPLGCLFLLWFFFLGSIIHSMACQSSKIHSWKQSIPRDRPYKDFEFVWSKWPPSPNNVHMSQITSEVDQFWWQNLF